MGVLTTYTKHSTSLGQVLCDSTSSLDPREQQGFISTPETPLSSREEVCPQPGSCCPPAHRGPLCTLLQPLLLKIWLNVSLTLKPKCPVPPGTSLIQHPNCLYKTLKCAATHTLMEEINPGSSPGSDMRSLSSLSLSQYQFFSSYSFLTLFFKHTNNCNSAVFGFTLFALSLEEEMKWKVLLLCGKQRHFPVTGLHRLSSGSWAGWDGIWVNALGWMA